MEFIRVGENSRRMKGVYRVSCNECEWRARIRIGRESAISVAEGHHEVTGHRVIVEEIDDGIKFVIGEN